MRAIRPFLTLMTLMTLSSLTACGDGDGATEPGGEVHTRQLELAHFQVPCEGEGRQLCLVGKRSTGETELLYAGIEGFDFEWGQRVTVEIREEAVANPPADGSSVRLILEDVISAKADRTSFELQLAPGDLIDTANGLSLLGLVRVECASEEICRAVQAQMGGSALTVKARAGAAPGDPIQLFRIM